MWKCEEMRALNILVARGLTNAAREPWPNHAKPRADPSKFGRSPWLSGAAKSSAAIQLRAWPEPSGLLLPGLNGIRLNSMGSPMVHTLFRAAPELSEFSRLLEVLGHWELPSLGW